MRIANTAATLLCALGLAAGTAAAQNSTSSSRPAARGVDPFPPLTLAQGDSPEQMFTPAKIAAVASQSNINEIDPSRVALTNSQNPQIQAYARDMILEHSQFETALRSMLNSKKMLAQDNALSLQLKRNAQPTLDSLRSKQGMMFDVAYVDQQIASHDMTLKTLDTSLIPLATDPDMKNMLQNQVRPAVVRHLARIKQIQQSMLAPSRAS